MKNSTRKILALIITAFVNTVMFAQAPLINLQFNEASGAAPANTGSVAATFIRSAGTPASSTNAPAGVGGSGSFDFGTTANNYYYVKSTTVINDLKNLSAFTITGWVNNRSNIAGRGGNRIVSWINNGRDGVDLVYQSNGSLRLGVDGWPDRSPAFSSANKVPTNASGAASNWTFFAVTYASNGQVQFYFGSNATDATLDVTRSYPGRGVTGSNINRLAIGAFNIATRGRRTERMFRGLIDDIKVYNTVLDENAIRAVQRGSGGGPPDTTPPSTPQQFAVTDRNATSASLRWEPSTDNVDVTEYRIYDRETLLTTVAAPSTVATLAIVNDQDYALNVRAADAVGNLSEASNYRFFVGLPPNSINNPIVDLKMEKAFGSSENEGVATATGIGLIGNTSGPSSSSNVPSGVGLQRSLDFGTTPTDNGLKSYQPIGRLNSMGSFTLAGWLNNKSSTTGANGNTILSWAGGADASGVDLVYQADGSLKIAVNEPIALSSALSSPNKVPTDANASASNWIFFAVTYQSTGQLRFYFGNNTSDAALDLERSYSKGTTGNESNYPLSIGALNPGLRAGDPSDYESMFRGLMDNIKVYGYALSPAEIVAIQRGNYADTTPPTTPANLTANGATSTSVDLSWTASTDNVKVVEYSIYNDSTLLWTESGEYTSAILYGLEPGTTYNLSVKARDAAGRYSASSNVVTIGTNPSLPLFSLRFDEPSGFFYGSPSGQFAGGARSTNTPPRIGAPFALDGAVSDFFPTNSLGGKQKVTITGWLNCKASAAGSFGNPVFTWRDGSNSGIDLVYQSDGSLRLGINELAANSPAVSNAAKVTTDSAAGPNNWIFFAATYDANGQVQFFFGNSTVDAALDVTRTYTNRGATAAIDGGIGIGQYNIFEATPPATGLGFSGLMDDLYVFDRVLTLSEIINIQRGPDDDVAPTPPTGLSLVSQDQTSATLQWSDGGSDNVRITSKEVYDGNTFVMTHYYDVRNTNTWSNVRITGLTPGTYNFNVRNKDAHGNISAASNTVVVTIPDGANNVARMPEPLIAVEEPGLETQMFQNFPNPFNGTTNIEMYIQPNVRVARVQVIDMTGRSLQNIQIHGRGRTSVTVSSDNMVTGVYMCSFVVDGKVIDRKRMAVTK